MANYSMNELQRLTNRTPQSIRQVFKKEEKLIKLMAEHKTETPNRKVYYDDAILDALLEYYGISKNNTAVEDETGGKVEDTENPEKSTNSLPPPVESVSPSAPPETQIEALKRQIAALEDEKHKQEKDIADLEKQLQDKEAERLHFIGENAKLINLLAAEKQEKEKLLLLMPPATEKKKGLWNRIKRHFTREKEGVKE